MTMQLPNEDYQVVFHLNRWGRTEIQFSFMERIAILFTGRYNLDRILGYDSIGWVPVFGRRMDADAYRRENSPTATVLPVQRRFEEP
jgi:hypothetical protein